MMSTGKVHELSISRAGQRWALTELGIVTTNRAGQRRRLTELGKSGYQKSVVKVATNMAWGANRVGQRGHQQPTEPGKRSKLFITTAGQRWASTELGKDGHLQCWQPIRCFTWATVRYCCTQHTRLYAFTYLHVLLHFLCVWLEEKISLTMWKDAKNVAKSI
jgi:hypothetical protein